MLGIVAIETWRLVWPHSALFAPPPARSLAEAIAGGVLDQTYAFLQTAEDPRAPIAVRHRVFTDDRVVMASPLLWAAATRNKDVVSLLIGFGGSVATDADRDAPCVAEAAGRPDIAEMLRAHVPPRSEPCSGLRSGDPPLLSFLLPDGVIRSPNGAFRLIYQQDGNLVLYNERTGAPVWASGTVGATPGSVVLHMDGEMIVHDVSGTLRWTTGAKGRGGASLDLDDDGKLIIQSDGRVVWSCCK
jgi:hypothetical protein